MKVFVNSLTLIRLLATFILPFVWRILSPLGIIIFVSCVLLTDFFDGLFARTFHVQSLFGSLLDTIADKVFGIVIILIVAIYYPIYYIIAILEIIIALINVVAASIGLRTKSSFIGRAKMWVLGISTVMGIIYIFQTDLIKIAFLKPVLDLILANKDILMASVFLTAGSEIMVGIDYVRKLTKEFKESQNKIKYNFKTSEELKHILFDTEYYLANKEMPMSKHLLK
ncbi:MAG: CDP-alcohol phosphatidyltransferase family protein [Bacilli bacterium]|nr:CDP-alcohol phosphatidyltransferase family protein [Bacilli bacterium]